MEFGKKDFRKRKMQILTGSNLIFVTASVWVLTFEHFEKKGNMPVRQPLTKCENRIQMLKLESKCENRNQKLELESVCET